MERFLFIKEEKGLLSFRVSERLYTEIVKCLELSEQQITDLFRQAETGEIQPLEPESKNSLVLDEIVERADFIFVKDRDYFRKVNFSRIRWIEASGSYCCLHLEDAPKLMLSFNLRELAIHLPSRFFIRVHRSYIVNLRHVDSFIGNMLCIGKEHIPVSKQHKRNMIARLNVLGNVK